MGDMTKVDELMRRADEASVAAAEAEAEALALRGQAEQLETLAREEEAKYDGPVQMLVLGLGIRGGSYMQRQDLLQAVKQAASEGGMAVEWAEALDWNSDTYPKVSLRLNREGIEGQGGRY